MVNVEEICNMKEKKITKHFSDFMGNQNMSTLFLGHSCEYIFVEYYSM